MRLANNITALQIATSMKKVNRYAMASSLRMSSGLKINHAKDDPAGLAISNRLQTINKINFKAQENYSDGVNLAKTVESSIASVTDMLQRMRELSVQSATDTVTNDDRIKIQVEIDQLKQEINDMSKRSSFNGIKFLNGDSTRLTYATNESVVDYNYVSGNVPEGVLKYSVDAYGTPAEIAFTELTPETNTAGSNGTINLNGYTIDVSASDTYGDINNKIKQACDATSIEYFNNKLITRGEGSDETINFKVEPAGFLGFADATATGTDAQITLDGLYQKEDQTIAIDSFNNGAGIKIDGNEITITAPNNQVVEMSLDFKLDGTGQYLYGNQTTFTPYTESSTILDSGQLKIQTGDGRGREVDMYFRKINTSTLRIDEVNLLTAQGSEKALGQIDEALGKMLSYRAELGAYENRMSAANSTLDDVTTNIATHLSTLRDTDMAYEMSFYTNQNVKMQAAMSILAQANQRPQQVLQLLG